MNVTIVNVIWFLVCISINLWWCKACNKMNEEWYERLKELCRKLSEEDNET